jgi:predicted dinucleotide-binding enzyme
VTVRLGIVGLGNWGHQLAATVAKVDGAALVNCYSRTPATRRSFADAHDIRPVTSLADLVKDVDGVLVATPHSTHADVVVELASSGVAIMVEKRWPCPRPTPTAARMPPDEVVPCCKSRTTDAAHRRHECSAA